MNAVDPMSTKYSSVTPYNYSFNNPVNLNDPSGADPNVPGDYDYTGSLIDLMNNGSWSPGMSPMTVMDPGGGGGGFMWNPATAGGYGVAGSGVYSDGSISGWFTSHSGRLNKMYSDAHGMSGQAYASKYGQRISIADGMQRMGEYNWAVLENSPDLILALIRYIGEHNTPIGLIYLNSKTLACANCDEVDVFGIDEGVATDPDIQSFVNPLSFRLSNLFGRYVSYVNYEETFSIALDAKTLRVYDRLNLKFDKIALSVRVNGREDLKVLSKLAAAFDQARFRLYNDFADRGIFNMMTDGEGKELFIRYLNERLQIYFPSLTETYARPGYNMMWVGDAPSSKITFIGPFFFPN